MTPSRLILALALAAAAVGCGGNDQLSVNGEAAVTFAPDYVERFTFDTDTQLEKDDLAASTEGIFSGHCVLSKSGLTAVDVEIDRPGATSGMTTFRVQAQADSGGAMRAVVDGVAYDGTADGSGCTIDTLYSMPNDGTAAIQVDCGIADSDGATATASAELHFAGCVVTD